MDYPGVSRKSLHPALCAALISLTSAACSGGGPPTAPTSPSTTPSDGFVVTSALFDQMFPSRNPFYAYADFIDATKSYPAFAMTGSDTLRRQEAAAFLANVGHETGDLFYIEQIEKGDYCDGAYVQYPCAAGKQYYGRGPLQLSWNYNYGEVGAVLRLPLLTDPDRVARDAAVAWQTSLWYWMTQTGPGTQTPHDVMVSGAGFGETIRSVNGAQECNGGNPAQVQSRIDRYTTFTRLLGVAPGANLGC